MKLFFLWFYSYEELKLVDVKLLNYPDLLFHMIERHLQNLFFFSIF